ncbi:MAG: 6-phosphofructo-2-kinase/fructose-2,6-bisphosphatase [Myxococcales bacterium]|nr:6-phosphofructo-2-kinase/fructose-2,6-bisphosphatase [Myxococcales bacterium]
MQPVGPEAEKLVLVMVGLPARGKSYTARKVARYLTWLGYRTRVFNVGEYRRARFGAKVAHDFFDPENAHGREARRTAAMAALADLQQWLRRDGDVAIYDATNSTVERRAMVRERCTLAGFDVLYLEIFCEDEAQIDATVRETKLTSPDYAGVPEATAIADFRARIAHYERAYEPLQEDEGSYLRVKNRGEHVTAHRVHGYVASRLGFLLMNLHLNDRPIWLTRHGESMFNVAGLIGGDADLSPDGQRYAHSLADHLDACYPDTDALKIWTSSLRRALQTANPLGRKSTSWRALDEIDAGVCDGMSYAQIEAEMPDEYAARQHDKFTYRYPRGESYVDVIHRLDPVIIEIERVRRPVLVIAHQAVLRALYAYFMGVEPERCPHLPIPLHTVIKLTPHAYGCHEERVPLEPNTAASGTGGDRASRHASQ